MGLWISSPEGRSVGVGNKEEATRIASEIALEFGTAEIWDVPNGPGMDMLIATAHRDGGLNITPFGVEQGWR